MYLSHILGMQSFFFSLRHSAVFIALTSPHDSKYKSEHPTQCSQTIRGTYFLHVLGFLPVLNIVLISLIAFYFRSCHTDLIWTLVIILGPASCRVEREPKLLNFERIWFWVRDCCYLGGTSGRTCMMCTGTFWVHAGSCQARFGLWILRHIPIQDTLVVGHYLYQKKNLKNHHRG